MKILCLSVILCLLSFCLKAQSKGRDHDRSDPDRPQRNQLPEDPRLVLAHSINIFNTLEEQVSVQYVSGTTWLIKVIGGRSTVTLDSTTPVVFRITTGGHTLQHTLKPAHYYLIKVNEYNMYDIYLMTD